MRFNFPDRSVCPGLPCVINSEEAFICCDLNVYLFYPQPTRQLQMLPLLQLQAWKRGRHGESCKAYEFQALCWHLTRWIHAGARKWSIFLFGEDERFSAPQNLTMHFAWALIYLELSREACRVTHILPNFSTAHCACGHFENINVCECFLPPVLGSLLTQKSLMGPSIWDRLWLELEQVAHSVFQS